LTKEGIANYIVSPWKKGSRRFS